MPRIAGAGIATGVLVHRERRAVALAGVVVFAAIRLGGTVLIVADSFGWRRAEDTAHDRRRRRVALHVHPLRRVETAASRDMMSPLKDETGRETRTWVGISLCGAECEIGELVAGGQSFVLKIDGKIVQFDLPMGKLLVTMERAAEHIRAHLPELENIAKQLDVEVANARRDQQRLGIE